MWLPLVISFYLALTGYALPAAHENDSIGTRDRYYSLSQVQYNEPVKVAREAKRMRSLTTLLKNKFNKKSKFGKKDYLPLKKLYNKNDVKINLKEAAKYYEEQPNMTKVRIFVNNGFPPQVTAETIVPLELQSPTKGFVPSLTIEVLSPPRRVEYLPEKEFIPPFRPFDESITRHLLPPTRHLVLPTRSFVVPSVQQMVPPTKHTSPGMSSSRITNFI